METYTVYSLLTLGFGLGLLHALDADHIMAVSALVNRRRGVRTWRSVVQFCLRWALGHGGVLLALAAALALAGLELPPVIALLAEKAVAVLLIVIGLLIFRSLYTQSVRFAIHTHSDVTHLHITKDNSSEHDHTPILVGITHGVAGSAPLLAIIPATNASSHGAMFALAYVAVFSIGVVIAMVIFGLALARVQNWLAASGRRIFNISRCAIATISIAIGSWWLISAH